MTTQDQTATEIILGFVKRLRAFYPECEAWLWMSKSHEAFGGNSAVYLISDMRESEVDAEIHMLETGAYT